MDTGRTFPAAVRTPSYGENAGTLQYPSRSNSQTSDDTFPPREAMPIPGARLNDAPPPLPPPRYNEELDHGIDLAWSWANSDPLGNTARRLAPIKPTSSLFGGYMQSKSGSGRLREDEMDLDEHLRRGSNASTARSPKLMAREAGHAPTMPRKPPSPGMASQRLQGEMPLARQNFTRSSQAYDQRVLSKIGKPNSPPRHQRTGSMESPMFPRNLALQTKESKIQVLSANEHPNAPLDSISRWITSPVSGGVSPNACSGWREGKPGHRNSSVDCAAGSLVLDPELFVPPRPTGLISTGSSVLGHEDAASLGGRSQRGSYDQGTLAESELLGDENCAFRNLICSDRDPPLPATRRPSQQGMKRRALSPPSHMAREDKSPLLSSKSTEPLSRIQTTSSTMSPVSPYRLQHGSVSSTSSSIRQNSYSSSLTLSVGGSSMTSVSSHDRQSPLDSSHPAYLSSAQPVSSPATSVTPSVSQPTQSPVDTKPPYPTMSIHTAVNETRVPLPPATRIGNYFICDCCPKKPKKFEAEADLRAHQMEKQYSCQYCHNRFKNKNEAERHQNSLHLRRHSWSCASIPNYQAVFYPTTGSGPSGSQASQTDTCGFCGEEFPNFPRPDWDCRIEHLALVHKFGECNQSKKFYRADHFRQHLKHSHGGQSGKWTNMLENVCLREEFPDAGGISPTTKTYSPGRNPGTLPEPPMGGATINEVQDET
ncbi:hypothetical protein ABEF91_000710 [Exophiala dermatitidis]